MLAEYALMVAPFFAVPATAFTVRLEYDCIRILLSSVFFVRIPTSPRLSTKVKSVKVGLDVLSTVVIVHILELASPIGEVQDASVQVVSVIVAVNDFTFAIAFSRVARSVSFSAMVLFEVPDVGNFMPAIVRMIVFPFFTRSL